MTVKLKNVKNFLKKELPLPCEYYLARPGGIEPQSVKLAPLQCKEFFKI